MWIPVRRAWMGFFKPPEPDKGESFFILWLRQTDIFFFFDWTFIELHYRDSRKKCLIAESIPSITSVSTLRATLSADRVYRSREIAPRDVDRAAQFAHYRESEDKRDAISSPRILSAPERPARYVFSSVLWWDSRARAVRSAKTWLRETRI